VRALIIIDPAVSARNHDPRQTWDPMIDYQMMSRNVRGFMSLFHANKPVVCKVHGFCVAGGTDMALCSDLLVIAEDAKIGYPPARVWGSPTTSVWAFRVGIEKAKRLLFTGDCLNGREAVMSSVTRSKPRSKSVNRGNGRKPSADAPFAVTAEHMAQAPHPLDVTTAAPVLALARQRGLLGTDEALVGETDAFARLLADIGYSGWVGCEYNPRGDTVEGLKWARPYL